MDRVVHFAEGKNGELRTACGKALVQGIATTSDREQVNCWECDFAIVSVRPARNKKKPVKKVTP